MKREKRKEKNERKNIIFLCAICAICAICIEISGCTSLVEKTGRFLDGSNEKITEKYQSENDMEILKVINREKKESMLIIFKNYHMIKLRTTLPDDNNLINIIALEYFGSSVQGWNEFSMVMLGNGYLILSENPRLEKMNEIEQIQITSGRIHRFNTRITGDEAVTALRNRNERILSLTEWMRKYPEEKTVFETIDQFNNYWMPVILPEIAKNNTRPENWRLEGDKFLRAEDINWNTNYSERIMPEELRPIRDSGTLLRDWEEALPWIYMEYHWENIVELLKEPVILKKIK